MNYAIEVQGLRKTYPDFTLQDVSFTLPSGGILGLVGENGAGKSTVIRLLMNALSRDRGTVRLLGVDNRSAEFSALKEEIGVVLDEASFPEVMSARQVEQAMRHTYRQWDSALYAQYLQRFDLPPKKPFKEYSRGMKMKLAIAVALSHHPRLLILDEATGGLDPMVRDEILDIFYDFTRQEDHSILISSHIVSDLEKLCDYIAFLHKGQLLLCQEKERILEDHGVVKLSRAQLQDLPEGAVLGLRENPYGVEALVRRDAVSPAFPVERCTLEEIIILLAKGGNGA